MADDVQNSQLSDGTTYIVIATKFTKSAMQIDACLRFTGFKGIWGDLKGFEGIWRDLKFHGGFWGIWSFMVDLREFK